MAKVLVIDDSRFQRKWIVKAVQQLGHCTVEAVDGRDGLGMLDAERPECITIDLNMPEMNGLEFLENLQAQNLRPPVIVITADIQKDTREQCRLLGASAFLNKPFKPGELHDALAKCIDLESKDGV
ncbi:MAG: response regulator [candidate division Zixibacteria bacterium]|nr:response regulator [candidate division Zixibacteria bacterium]